MTSYKITLPGQVPGPLQGPARVQALLQVPWLLPGPVLALQALPGPVQVLPSSPLPQASVPLPSCNLRLQRTTSQRKVLKTERIKSSSSSISPPFY